ncbi:VOC family protein [Kribbella sp. NPDC051586]|uniref:VOC family protein n=1 Tax=Kribbella sp. NPDC051586 TaxID=3364118 RepID=UPI0037951A46
MTNTATFPAYFGYRDAPGALRWLGKAFTLFTDEAQYDRPARKGDTVGHGMYVAFDSQDEVDALYATAIAAGAESVWIPELSEWGNYRCRVADPEGYEWTFGTHRPGQPANW